MDEKKDTRQESDEERARRLRRQRRIRQEMRRRRRRRALILRGVLAVAGILIVVLLIWGISALAGKIGGGEKKTADGEKTEQTGQTETAEEEELEEERRLAYVAITRAKRKLCITCAGQRMLFGMTQHNLPSRFLAELPTEDVERVDFSGAEKRLFTSSGEEYGAGAVIVATGRKPRPLPVQTSFERVHYCSVCDGAPYKGKHVIVVGGGNSGFDESLYLIGLGVNHVHIVEAFPSCIAAASTQDRARESGRIGVSVSTEKDGVFSLWNGQSPK